MNWKRAVLGVAAVSLVLAASAFGQKDAPPAQEGGRPQPPPEAFAACKDKQEGDKAELTGPQGQKITGTCVKHGEQLFLRPDREGQGGQEGRPQPPLEAFAACKNKQEGDKAELTGPQGQKITGTCVKHGEQLFLRPDHPPKEGGGAGGPKRQQGQ